MTEYWVSQGNKWCDFCKIFLQNNPSSIRNHELGQRHKDNVSKKLADMREKNVAKEKEQKEAARALLQIEAKANRSYQKDIAKVEEAGKSNIEALNDDGQGKWEHDVTSGYYYNQANGLYYDSNSGFYYSDAIGKWVSQKEAYAAINVQSAAKVKGPILKKPLSTSVTVTEKKDATKNQTGVAPGPVVSASLHPMRSSKGAPSSLAVGKRKRQDEKPKKISAEEAAALKAREAAKKRVEDREKSLLGLYKRPL